MAGDFALPGLGNLSSPCSYRDGEWSCIFFIRPANRSPKNVRTYAEEKLL